MSVLEQLRRPRKMDSYLSLDELFVSFPNQALKSRMRNRRRGEDSDVFRERSGDRGNSYDRAEDKEEIHSKNETFTVADYVLANGERESYAGKLPSIRPVSVRQTNMLKKGRNRDEFSCIDLDDFSGWEKPVMTNTRRDGKEGTNRRNNLLSPGSQLCPGGENWESDVVRKSCFAKKKSSDSASSCNALVYRPRQLSLGSFTDLHGQNAERRIIFSPPVTPKPERPVDLPEKFTRFLEMEFSIIKGENVSSTLRSPFRSDSDLSQEKEPLNSNSMELRKTERPFNSELEKPVMANTNRNIKERSKYSINKRQDTLPCSGPRRCSVGDKWESDSVAESIANKKISSDLPNLCEISPAKLDLSRRTQSLSLERKGTFTASQRDISPRLSRTEFEDRPLFSSSESRRHVQELPLDLPEKIAKFIEVEFSIIKGEDASSTQKQKYGVSADTVSSRDKVPLSPNPKELRKSPTPLLQRRGR